MLFIKIFGRYYNFISKEILPGSKEKKRWIFKLNYYKQLNINIGKSFSSPLIKKEDIIKREESNELNKINENENLYQFTFNCLFNFIPTINDINLYSTSTENIEHYDNIFITLISISKKKVITLRKNVRKKNRKFVNSKYYKLVFLINFN